MLRENARQNYEKNLIRIQNSWNMFNIFNIFEVNHLKKFLRATKCSFNKPAVNFPREVERNVTQKAKMIKKIEAKSENVYVGTPIAV